MSHPIGAPAGGPAARAGTDGAPAALAVESTAGLSVDHLSIERAARDGRLEIALFRPAAAPDHALRLKLFHPGVAIALSDVVPLLEHFGLRVIDEIPSVVHGIAAAAPPVFVHDIGVESATGAAIDLSGAGPRLAASVRAVWQGASESDRFNALVLEAGLAWRQVVVVRAYARFLRQAGLTFSQAYIEDALNRAPAIAAALVRLFEARFDPASDAPGEGERGARTLAMQAEIGRAIDGVAGADDDRILRRFLDAITCTVRTNHFQRTAAGEAKPWLALKLDSRRLAGLPRPRPMVEIFVYAPEVEGIHLRGGKVARGGIRWSERREDYRSEILGLMKAQMVKNVVIVPVGAKGGFVVKEPPASRGGRGAADDRAIACYRTFIAGLLDLTDSLDEGRVVPPQAVVRHDGDDPYLVVAADKGTARFSDIANALAQHYGYWLGDAFASGGSRGYDHKRMGITARGAWALVRQHFLELGRDIDRETITVVGVGDMSGDVFGNAMLRSPGIRLIAAFDHRHIFVDPDPDPAASFAERARLFAMPASSWQDYPPKALSAGGGVFARSAKAIRLAPEAARRFGLEATRLTPEALIQAILTAPVDLLWFGGIGTFVKAAAEPHSAAGDRANDGVRVDAEALRCRVIGEGANLALTQRARIAFARAGGRLNTDFIDNAAGVATSDREVNIKILLDAAVAAGELDGSERNRLLAAMADEVAALVLRDITQQGRAIARSAADGTAALDVAARLIRALEHARGLDRAQDALPDDATLACRLAAGEGLSRPEICVLFAEAKIWLNEAIVASALPDDPHLLGEVVRYFPAAIGVRFERLIAGHRLRRELIATAVTNSLINRLGGGFLVEIGERTGADAAAIARAYVIARDAYGLRGLWEAIEALDGRVPFAVQAALERAIQDFLGPVVSWLLRHATRPDAIDDAIGAQIAAYAPAIAALGAALDRVLPDGERTALAARAATLVADGVPDGLAQRIAELPALAAAGACARLAVETGSDVVAVAQRLFLIARTLGLADLRRAVAGIAAAGPWQRAALECCCEELDALEYAIARAVLAIPASDAAAAVAAWCAGKGTALAAMQALLAQLRDAGPPDLAMVVVASRRLRSLIAP